MDEVCQAISRGSLMGARGNSGVILSQILRGLADTCRPLESVPASDLVRGFRHAADAAYEAVMRPVEGTILTVAREIAEAIEGLDAPSLLAVLERGAEAGRDAVARTPDLLPGLARRGSCRRGRQRPHAPDRRVPRGGRRPPDSRARARGHAGRRRGASRRWRRRLGSPLRGHVPPRRRGRDAARVPRGLGVDRRLDRGRRRRRHLELPRAHERHRRRGRGGNRRGPPAPDPHHRLDGAGGRGTLGARGRGRRRSQRRGRELEPGHDGRGRGRRR